MINGLAIWHYPTRTDLENVRFFADHGFASVSMHGRAMAKVCMDDTLSAEFAALVKEKQLILTAHGKLPLSHGETDVSDFKRSIDAIAKWQKQYGALAILSFDVPLEIRDCVLPYIEYVLAYEQFDKIAVEDFGLTDAERAQIEPLKDNQRFGYLIDVGHMNIRLHGINMEDNPLFTNFIDECPKTDYPGFEDFLRAFKAKEFPIFEIHLHNNDGIADQHDFLDHGTIDMKDIARVLKTIGYDGVVTIETVPRLQGYFRDEADERIFRNFDIWKDYVEETK